jgi:hypothetical protein
MWGGAGEQRVFSASSPKQNIEYVLLCFIKFCKRFR